MFWKHQYLFWFNHFFLSLQCNPQSGAESYKWTKCHLLVRNAVCWKSAVINDFFCNQVILTNTSDLIMSVSIYNLCLLYFSCSFSFQHQVTLKIYCQSSKCSVNPLGKGTFIDIQTTLRCHQKLSSREYSVKKKKKHN